MLRCFIFLKIYNYSYLPVGVKTLNVEIYDESAFTMDELIAHGSIQIPDAVFRNESVGY